MASKKKKDDRTMRKLLGLAGKIMVTLITEQLRKQSLEEPYCKAFSINVTVSLPAVGSSPTVSWSACRSTQEPISTTHPVCRANTSDVSSGPDALWLRSHSGEPVQTPEISFAALQNSPPPPPPPPKRHCRSLSVPEDLPRCRSTWHPTASKVWTPVKRDSRSGQAASSTATSLPFFGPSSSFTSSSLHSSSSPTFFSLALSPDSPLSWSLQWDSCSKLQGGCSTSVASTSSCCCSPAPLLQRRFSLSPVHIQDASSLLLSPRPAPAATSAHGGWGGTGHPTLPPSPTSACSTPSTSRRHLHPALPRCHSQPCDLRRPRLKRRHDADVLPCPRPGLDFSKMTQRGNQESRVSGAGGGTASSQPEAAPAFSPAPEFLGQASIGPLSESDEEDEEEDGMGKRNVLAKGYQLVFERDCTELDLNLIEEN